MLRRAVRLRKEYLFRKAVEEKERIFAEKKQKLREAIEAGKSLSGSLRGPNAHQLISSLDLDDANTSSYNFSHIDDEYAYAGVKDPKVVITTSRSPSSRLQQFVKELRLLIPGCQRINRGGYVLTDLMDLCRSNDVTDLLIIHEHRGQPDAMVVCHLPHGPAAYFSLFDVALRHDLPEKPVNMSEAAPHLIFHNFTTRLGRRIANILRFLFPPSAAAAQRVHAFVNVGDVIHFRHYNWITGSQAEAATAADAAAATDAEVAGRTKGAAGGGGKEEDTGGEEKEKLELIEVGPRFSLKPYRIDLGTAEMKDVETEWALRPYFNRPKAALAD